MSSASPHTYILYGMLMHWNSFRGKGDTTGSAKTKGNTYVLDFYVLRDISIVYDYESTR